MACLPAGAAHLRQVALDYDDHSPKIAPRLSSRSNPSPPSANATDHIGGRLAFNNRARGSPGPSFMSMLRGQVTVRVTRTFVGGDGQSAWRRTPTRSLIAIDFGQSESSVDFEQSKTALPAQDRVLP